MVSHSLGKRIIQLPHFFVSFMLTKVQLGCSCKHTQLHKTQHGQRGWLYNLGHMYSTHSEQDDKLGQFCQFIKNPVVAFQYHPSQMLWPSVLWNISSHLKRIKEETHIFMGHQSKWSNGDAWMILLSMFFTQHCLLNENDSSMQLISIG